MKKIVISFILALIIGIISFISLSLLKKDYIIAKDDSLRHNKFAYNITKYGFIENDLNHNWGDVTAHSILDKYNVDLWQGHHLFLAVLLKLGVDINDLNKYYISIFLFLLSFIILFLNFELKNSLVVGLGVITLGLFLNIDAYIRILLSRPYLFTGILFLLVLIILYKKKYLWLFLVFLIGAFYHFLFLFLFFPLVIYALVYRLNLKNNLKIFGSSIIGSIIGILIHTKSISYVILGFISLFYVPILQVDFRSVVSEFKSYDGISIYILISINLSIFLYLFFTKKEQLKDALKKDRFFIFINIYTFLLFFLTLYFTRFIDFFIITYIFNLLYISKYLITIKDIKISLRINIYFSIILLIIISIIQTINILNLNKRDFYDISESRTFLYNSKEYLEKGSLIASNSLYNFFNFYYYLGEDYKYLMTMEQMYIYLNDKNIFNNLFETIFSYKFHPDKKTIASNDIYKTLKSLGVDYYFITSTNEGKDIRKSLGAQVQNISNDPNFKLIYRYKKNYLWKLK